MNSEVDIRTGPNL